LLSHGRWFSLGTLTSSTTKTGHHDIAEILLKLTLKHQKSKPLLAFLAVVRVSAHDVSKWLYDLSGLAFPSPEEVADCFTEELVQYMPNDKKVKVFC
jgi:hypothetical protein